MQAVANELSSNAFLSTPSVRRATASGRIYQNRFIVFLSTPSVRRATCC